jgi:hypothetical protein
MITVSVPFCSKQPGAAADASFVAAHFRETRAIDCKHGLSAAQIQTQPVGFLRFRRAFSWHASDRRIFGNENRLPLLMGAIEARQQNAPGGRMR